MSIQTVRANPNLSKFQKEYLESIGAQDDFAEFCYDYISDKSTMASEPGKFPVVWKTEDGTMHVVELGRRKALTPIKHLPVSKFSTNPNLNEFQCNVLDRIATEEDFVEFCYDYANAGSEHANQPGLIVAVWKVKNGDVKIRNLFDSYANPQVVTIPAEGF